MAGAVDSVLGAAEASVAVGLAVVADISTCVTVSGRDLAKEGRKGRGGGEGPCLVE